MSRYLENIKHLLNFAAIFRGINGASKFNVDN